MKKGNFLITDASNSVYHSSEPYSLSYLKLLLFNTFSVCNLTLGACRGLGLQVADNTLALYAIVDKGLLGTYLITVFVLYACFSTYINFVLFSKGVFLPL